MVVWILLRPACSMHIKSCLLRSLDPKTLKLTKVRCCHVDADACLEVSSYQQSSIFIVFLLQSRSSASTTVWSNLLQAACLAKVHIKTLSTCNCCFSESLNVLSLFHSQWHSEVRYGATHSAVIMVRFLRLCLLIQANF